MEGGTELWDHVDPDVDSVGRGVSLGQTLLDGVRSLYQDSSLFDYRIKIEEEEYQVHKLVMAVISDFFKVMFSSQFPESQECSIDLKGISKSGFEPILNFIYKDEQLKVNRENVISILSCATQLQMEIVLDECIDFLLEDINVENCVETLNLALFYGLKSDHLVRISLDCILDNFDDLVQDPEFNKISSDGLKKLLSTDVFDKSEIYRLVIIQNWLSANEQRSNEVHALLEDIRFALICPNKLKDMPQTFPYLKDTPASRAIYEAALQWHEIPINKRVLVSKSDTSVRMNSDHSTIVCLGGQLFSEEGCNENNESMYFLNDKYAWEAIEEYTAPPDTVLRCCATTVVNNYLIVCGGYENLYNTKATKNCLIFDPRTITWHKIASMNVARANTAIVYHDRHLYVFGGDNRGYFTNLVERYNFETNCWERFASLERPSTNMAACCLDNLIYVIGGQSSFGRGVLKSSKSINLFNPVTKEWLKRPELTVNIHSHTVVEMTDRNTATPRSYHQEKCLYVVPRQSSSIHAYFPSCCQWHKIKLKGMPPYDATVIEYLGDVFYINGWVYEVDQNTREKYKAYSACGVYNPNSINMEKLDYIDPYPVEVVGLIACELSLNVMNQYV